MNCIKNCARINKFPLSRPERDSNFRNYALSSASQCFVLTQSSVWDDGKYENFNMNIRKVIKGIIYGIIENNFYYALITSSVWGNARRENFEISVRKEVRKLTYQLLKIQYDVIKIWNVIYKMQLHMSQEQLITSIVKHTIQSKFETWFTKSSCLRCNWFSFSLINYTFHVNHPTIFSNNNVFNYV